MTDRTEIVEAVKKQLIYRAEMIMLVPDQVFHVDDGETTYVICNPVVSRESIYDESGEPTGETVPRRNVEAFYQGPMWENDGEKITYHMKVGLRPILIPDLIARIMPDGEVLMGEAYGDSPMILGRPTE